MEYVAWKLVPNYFFWNMTKNWPNFINRPCLLPKLFSKMYFLFYA